MSKKPKRRWYQFSLRTLLVTIAVLAVVMSVCGRIAFLQRWAQFHEEEAMRCAWSIIETDERHGSPRGLFEGKSLEEAYGRDGTRMRGWAEKQGRHAALARKYHAAVYRPWMIVDEMLPEEPSP